MDGGEAVRWGVIILIVSLAARAAAAPGSYSGAIESDDLTATSGWAAAVVLTVIVLVVLHFIEKGKRDSEHAQLWQRHQELIAERAALASEVKRLQAKADRLEDIAINQALAEAEKSIRTEKR